MILIFHLQDDLDHQSLVDPITGVVGEMPVDLGPSSVSHISIYINSWSLAHFCTTEMICKCILV